MQNFVLGLDEACIMEMLAEISELLELPIGKCMYIIRECEYIIYVIWKP